MAESRILQLGKHPDFPCRQLAHQLSAHTGCGHGAGLAVLQPAYYRRIYRDALDRFRRFAVNVWSIDPAGRSAEELAQAGLNALSDFISEVGLPSTLRALGVDDSADLKAIPGSCFLAPGGCRRMSQGEMLGILQSCMDNKCAAKGARVS